MNTVVPTDITEAASSSSRSAFKKGFKIVRAGEDGDGDLQRCISCWWECSSYPKLVRHLKEKKHFYPKSKLVEWRDDLCAECVEDTDIFDHKPSMQEVSENYDRLPRALRKNHDTLRTMEACLVKVKKNRNNGEM
jgi:hypothetical protein